MSDKRKSCYKVKCVNGKVNPQEGTTKLETATSEIPNSKRERERERGGKGKRMTNICGQIDCLPTRKIKKTVPKDKKAENVIN